MKDITVEQVNLNNRHDVRWSLYLSRPYTISNWELWLLQLVASFLFEVWWINQILFDLKEGPVECNWIIVSEQCHNNRACIHRARTNTSVFRLAASLLSLSLAVCVSSQAYMSVWGRVCSSPIILTRTMDMLQPKVHTIATISKPVCLLYITATMIIIMYFFPLDAC